MGAILGLFTGSSLYWLIGAVAALAAATCFGYYEGTSQAETKMAEAQTVMYNAGVTAQKNFDDTQFKNDKADSDKRHAADLGRQAMLKAALDKLPTLVPVNAACTVSAVAMKSLNDVVAQ
jgi:hypothetical protein